MRYIKFFSSTFKYKNYFTAFFTFIGVMFSWVFFRSAAISFAFTYLNDLVVNFSIPRYPIKGLYYVALLILFDFI